MSFMLLLSQCFTLSPYFLLFKTLQQKFLIAYNLPSSFLPSFSPCLLLALSSLCLSFCLFLDLCYMCLFRPASGLISSAAMQLDRDSFSVLFYSLLTSLFILTSSWVMSLPVLVSGHSYECCRVRAFDEVGFETCHFGSFLVMLFLQDLVCCNLYNQQPASCPEQIESLWDN